MVKPTLSIVSQTAMLVHVAEALEISFKKESNPWLLQEAEEPDQ
jgi:hypothetical protein